MAIWLEDWVREMALAANAEEAEVPEGMRWAKRLVAGNQHVKQIVGKVWPYILAGIGIGALKATCPRISRPRSWAWMRGGWCQWRW